MRRFDNQVINDENRFKLWKFWNWNTHANYTYPIGTDVRKTVAFGGNWLEDGWLHKGEYKSELVDT